MTTTNAKKRTFSDFHNASLNENRIWIVSLPFLEEAKQELTESDYQHFARDMCQAAFYQGKYSEAKLIEKELIDDPEYKEHINHMNSVIVACCARTGQEKGVSYMLGKGADVSLWNNQALWEASRWGHTSIVKILLKYGADPSANRCSSLRIACKFGRFEIANILIDAGADAAVGGGNCCFSNAMWCDKEKGWNEDLIRLLVTNPRIKVSDGYNEWLNNLWKIKDIELVRLILNHPSSHKKVNNDWFLWGNFEKCKNRDILEMVTTHFDISNIPEI